MLSYRRWFVIPTTPAKGQSFINSVTLLAYDPADVMDNENFATLLEGFVIILSPQVAQTNTKKVPVLNHLVFANIIWSTHIMVSMQSCIHPYVGRSEQTMVNYHTEGYHILFM